MATKSGEEKLKEMEAEMALFEQEVLGAPVTAPPAAPALATPVTPPTVTPVTEAIAPQAAASVAPPVEATAAPPAATPVAPQAEDEVAQQDTAPSASTTSIEGDEPASELAASPPEEPLPVDLPVPAVPVNRPIISTNTYQQVQQTLEARAAAAVVGQIVAPPIPFVGPGPPPRPPSLRPSFVPHVLQRPVEQQSPIMRPSFVPHVLQRSAGPRHPGMRHPIPHPHQLQHQHPLPPPPHQLPQHPHPHQHMHPHQNPYPPQHAMGHPMQHPMQLSMQHPLQHPHQLPQQHPHQLPPQHLHQLTHQLPHQQHPHQLPHPQPLMSHAIPGPPPPPPPPPPPLMMTHPMPRPPGPQMGPMGPMRPVPPVAPGSTVGPVAPMVPPSRAVIQAAPKMNQTVIQAAPTVYSAPVVKKLEEEIPEPMPIPEEKEIPLIEEMVIGPILPEVDPVQPELVVEPVSEDKKKNKQEKLKRCIRTAAGTNWEDPSLLEWDSDDFRIFCGDLGNEVNDDILARAFSRYPSFLKAKVIRDKRTGKTKGYGFVSFKDPNDYVRAMREMNGKYVGSRPIKLRKSMWKDRNIDVVRKKQKEKKKLGLR
ncbi:RNA-binding protein 42 isoform X2 [Pleurodeles waltl]|uniref:RNA-binding protein 42 isoform X2 n=1 Tax=Pleurodeles waltl TaxID=8319 RepID=UPI003709B8B9